MIFWSLGICLLKSAIRLKIHPLCDLWRPKEDPRPGRKIFPKLTNPQVTRGDSLNQARRAHQCPPGEQMAHFLNPYEYGINLSHQTPSLTGNWSNSWPEKAHCTPQIWRVWLVLTKTAVISSIYFTIEPCYDASAPSLGCFDMS